MDGKANGYGGTIYSGLKLRSSNDDFSDRPWRTVDHQEGDRVFYVNGGYDFVSTLRMFRVAFDAPEPTAKPADRPLAPGWTRANGRKNRYGDAWACTSNRHRSEIVSAVYANKISRAGACESCTEEVGVFVPAPTSEPRQSAATVKRAVDALAALVPKALPRCGKCSHAGHSGPCGGTSPNGEWGCPCGDLTAKDAKLAARGAYAVGAYNGRAGTHEHSQMSSLRSSDRETGATSVLLTNLAREKPPVRGLPRVRDIYLPGASDDGDGLPNHEVG